PARSPVPLGLAWFSLAGIAEREKAGGDGESAATGWHCRQRGPSQAKISHLPVPAIAVCNKSCSRVHLRISVGVSSRLLLAGELLCFEPEPRGNCVCLKPFQTPSLPSCLLPCTPLPEAPGFFILDRSRLSSAVIIKGQKSLRVPERGASECSVPQVQKHRSFDASATKLKTLTKSKRPL
ncbi:hypothetical protein BaRGS_00002652, partial [Batillaria attramentaria]